MRDELEGVIKVLVRHAWDDELRWPEISKWLDNFKGEVVSEQEEHLYVLYVLTRFMYFGRRQVREMLRSLYRDHFEAPLKQFIRKENGDTQNLGLIHQRYYEELESTRFLGVGNPAESGAHLLYYFRQINKLPKNLFADISSAFEPQVRNGVEIGYTSKNAAVKRYVFFDDLVGSGSQVEEYLGGCLPSIREESPHAEISYMCLFGTEEGMRVVNGPDLFNGKAICLFSLDDSFKAFESGSRHFTGAPAWFRPEIMREIALHYGNKLWAQYPLGYKSGQLLISFSHNTPDNVPPIFWDSGDVFPWNPVFLRYGKV